LKQVRLIWRVAGWGLALSLITPLTLAVDTMQDEASLQDFFEFLGEWEDEQGNWQDPLEYETPEDKLSAQVPESKVEQNNETR